MGISRKRCLTVDKTTKSVSHTVYKKYGCYLHATSSHNVGSAGKAVPIFDLRNRSRQVVSIEFHHYPLDRRLKTEWKRKNSSTSAAITDVSIRRWMASLRLRQLYPWENCTR